MVAKLCKEYFFVRLRLKFFYFFLMLLPSVISSSTDGVVALDKGK
jgi:hypothetical protein